MWLAQGERYAFEKGGDYSTACGPQAWLELDEPSRADDEPGARPPPARRPLPSFRETPLSSNADLHARRQAAIPRGVTNSLAVYAERASNAEIWDVEGKRYIDFASGISVLNTGHVHPKVKAAVAQQLEKLTHACFQVTPYESYVALAEKLNELVPGKGPKKTIFLTTGAEAVENAIKIARFHTKRSAIIAFTGGFHGRTIAASTLTGKVQPYKAGFGPMLPEVYHLPYPMAYHDVKVEDSLDALQQLFKADVDPARVAAVIIERCWVKAGSTPRRQSCCASCEPYATSTESCS